MPQLMSFSLAGLGWPSNQNVSSSSYPIGREPQIWETPFTPGIDATLLSYSRKAARIASGGAVINDGGSDKPTVSTLRGLKPGSTFHNRVKLRIIRPAP